MMPAANATISFVPLSEAHPSIRLTDAKRKAPKYAETINARNTRARRLMRLAKRLLNTANAMKMVPDTMRAISDGDIVFRLTSKMSHAYGWRAGCFAAGVTDMGVGSGDLLGFFV